jgi:hypothetical protein
MTMRRMGILNVRTCVLFAWDFIVPYALVAALRFPTPLLG